MESSIKLDRISGTNKACLQYRVSWGPLLSTIRETSFTDLNFLLEVVQANGGATFRK